MVAQVWLQLASLAVWGPRQALQDLRQAANGSKRFEKEPRAQDRLFWAKNGSNELKDFGGLNMGIQAPKVGYEGPR